MNALHEPVMEKLEPGQIREIYRKRILRDFPRDEIKPLQVILNAEKRGRYLCMGLRDEEEITAYAFFVTLPDCALLDYYAVREDLRGQGTGSRFLQAMIPHLKELFSCVLLESEDPEKARNAGDMETRSRRLRFYLKNGLADTGITACVWGVDYRILALPTGPVPSPEETRERFLSLYRVTMPASMVERKISVR